MSLDHLSAFVQDQWYIVAIAVIVLFIVVKMVKTMVKWVIILVVVAGVLVYGSNYKETLTSIKDTVVDAATSTVAQKVKDQALNAIKSEAKEAEFTKNADGSFTIKSKTVKLEGRPDAADVKVTIAGQSFNMKVDKAVQAFIDQAQQNQ